MSKADVIRGLQSEVTRLQVMLHDEHLRQSEIEYGPVAAEQALARIAELERKLAEAQRDLQRAPKAGTIQRLQEQLREAKDWDVTKQLECAAAREALHARITALRDPARSASFVAAGAVFGFALAMVWPHVL